MKNLSKNMNIITAVAGIVIFIAGMFNDDNRAMFMVVGALFAVMGIGMYMANRKKQFRP